MDKVLGIDVSFWQDDNKTVNYKVDFRKAAAAGARFVFVKVSQRNYADEDFRDYWKAAKEAGLLRGGYHFLTWDYNPKEQARVFWSLIKDDPGELPPVCDFEWWGNTPQNALVFLDQFVTVLEGLANKPPAIYTNYYFWKDYGSRDERWRRYPLWLAYYGPPSGLRVPPPWMDWTFWQFTSKGDGQRFGAESKNIDLNYFNGNEEELLVMAGRKRLLTLEERVLQLENRMAELERKVGLEWHG